MNSRLDHPAMLDHYRLMKRTIWRNFAHFVFFDLSTYSFNLLIIENLMYQAPTHRRLCHWTHFSPYQLTIGINHPQCQLKMPADNQVDYQATYQQSQ